jgi:hypothetical protein
VKTIKTFSRSFAGGEIGPELYGRLDLAKNQTGVALALNFEILPHGPARNRAGFAYVNEVKFSAKKTAIRPFSFSTTQTYILEFGDLYMRVHTLGATLLAGTSKNITAITKANPAVVTSVAHGYATGQWLFLQSIGGMTQLNGRWVKITVTGVDNYSLQDLAGVNINTTNFTTYTAGGTSTPPLEIVTPYVEADLFDVHFTQSADVLSVVHPSYDPQEVKRSGPTTWSIGAMIFAPTISTPAAPGVVASPTSGAKNYSYKTTALADTTLEESLPSPATAAVNDLTVAGNINTVTPAAVGTAVRHNVYKLLNGLYGYIGQTDVGTAFADTNYTPDVSKTPAIPSTPFAAAGDKPGAVGYYSQRRIFAGTNNKPQNYWATVSGTESNLGYSIPTRDSDTIAKRIIASEVNRIRHIVPLSRLIMLTSGGVWEVFPQNSDVLTPASADAKQQSTDGANNVAPILTGRSVLYVQEALPHVRELKYSISNNNVVFESNDISVMAPHLFDDFTITDSAHVRAPYRMGYWVRSDGRLVACTYMPEHEVAAWHQHSTDGTFESIAAVKESNEYPLYAVVNRTINARQVRYIERQHSRSLPTQADSFFVDSGATYSGAPVSTISGAYWLEGKTVSVLADGAEHPQVQIVNGSFTLQNPASKVQFGLPITAQLQTLPLSTEADQAYGQATKKTLSRVFVRVKDALTVAAGSSFTKTLREYPARSNEPYDTPPKLKRAVLPLTIDSSWGDDGQLCIQQTRPLPLTIDSIAIEVALGG